MQNTPVDKTCPHVTINKSFLYGSVYSYRVHELFYPFWCLTYRYCSVMGFTRNILCSLLYCKFSIHFCIFVNFIDFICKKKLVNTINLSFYCLTVRLTTAVVTIGVRSGMFLCLPSRQ